MKTFIPAAIALLALPLSALAQDQQVGARTKAMGGSYTAFEDDPVSVWLNPAGTATQPDAVSVAYQSYTTYPFETTTTGEPVGAPAETTWTDPAIIPSYLGAVFQLGDPENPHAIGFCFAAPFNMKLVYDSDLLDPNSGLTILNQEFYRIRASYAYDIRFRPAGTPGFFTHLAVGVGLDINITTWNYTEFKDISPNGSATITVDDQDMGFGGGVGLLLGVYDDTTHFKVNLGAAYQSRANYEFSISNAVVPLFDWPEQIQAGITFYLLEGQPLRVTFDAQSIGWNDSSNDSEVAGAPDFEDAINFSMGVEYRVPVGKGITIYPRAGLRLYDAPWEDENNLPAVGSAILVIDTDDEEFLIYSAGIGVGWATEAGKIRQFDISFDVGGDAPGVAFGFTAEF